MDALPPLVLTPFLYYPCTPPISRCTLNDIRTISAVERQFEIVGEAARRISQEFRQAYPEIDWQRIVGLRNVVAHRYGEVDQDVIWAIIQSELTPLRTQLEILLPPPNHESCKICLPR
ncbi:MAG: DUF86 domain-containing protein [Elainella sp.]